MPLTHTLINTLLQGKAYPAVGVFPPAWSPQSRPKGDYDPDKAKTLLVEAGYPDGFEFEIIGTDSMGLNRGTSHTLNV